MFEKLVPECEIAVNDYEDAAALMKILSNNNYVVMLSREEQLYIVSYTYDDYLMASRNGVVFMCREEFEENLFEEMKEDESW